uniref:Longin domain-containing protein n=1 Tax=Aegilops tauschii subsp. strangulata TaxID=200361 RepID=A0A453GTB5_AEGTS
PLPLPPAEYKVHCYNQGGLCAVAFTDDHYPVRSAFSLLGKVPPPPRLMLSSAISRFPPDVFFLY